MRNSYDRTARTKNTKSWIWWAATVGVLVLILIVRAISSGSTDDSSTPSLLVTPLDESTVYISMNSSSKARISGTEKLYATDKSVSVQVGWARAENSDLSIDLDKTTELTYKNSSLSGNILSLQKWRAWIKTLDKATKIDLKYMSITTLRDTVILVEQNNLSSTAYMIAGSASIDTKIGSYVLSAWNRIMIAGSDISNPGTALSSLSWPIDDSITEHPLFLRNGGKDILKTSIQLSTTNSWTNEVPWSSWATILSSGTKFIELTDPIDGSLIKNSTFAVMWNTLSPDVKRVTVNETPATLSPVNQTFVLQNIPLSAEVLNLVYKAYGDNDRLLERWVITVFWAKWAINEGGWRLLPENFPASNKDFPITFPTDNPYKTTESLVRVEWTVPKDTISYVMINDYRLQKFPSGWTKWYYFANTATETMKEWINLYNIKFYGKDNSLVYTQVFTIVKELKNATVSGENIQ